MADEYGSDFMTIVDEDGTEFELEILSTLEYNGATYLAVIPAVDAEEEADLEVSILKSVLIILYSPKPKLLNLFHYSFNKSVVPFFIHSTQFLSYFSSSVV